jgi:hypothetical protein
MARQVRYWAAFIGSGLILAAGAASAGASVTIGQLAPGTATPNCSNVSDDWLQPTEISGTGYVVPSLPPASALAITSWSTNASANAGQRWTMKVFRQVSGSTYMVVGHDGPRNLGGGLNTFAANVPVKPGDLLGMNDNDGSLVSTSCVFAASGDTSVFRGGNLADGASGSFTSPAANNRLNISAVVAPSNSFTLGRTIRNKKKGTATLHLTVPNPGDMTATGNGVKAASAGRAVISKAVGAGPAKLLIKAKGKKRAALNATGKVKLNVAVTFTPTSGTPSTQSLKVKLKKNL